MASKSELANRGAWVARGIRIALGGEIREARLTGGLSQDRAGAAVGMSGSQFGRIERAEIPGLTVEQASRAAAAVGLKLVARGYPDGDAVRDAAQLRLLDRFRARLPPTVGWQVEVPLPMSGDRRAWDAVVTVPSARIGLEAETRLRDIQAAARKLELKRRDGGVDLVILLIADSRSNRRVLAEHRSALRGALPLDGHAILAALRAGRSPGESGIVLR
jgi:transcriptional regulator with XRE-family HTH domain